jgi:hypothetical protein
LAEGQTAFGNRAYVWQNVPKQFAGWSVTRTCGGEPATLRVTVLRDTTLFVAATIGQAKVILKGWTAVPGAEFHYTDRLPCLFESSLQPAAIHGPSPKLFGVANSGSVIAHRLVYMQSCKHRREDALEGHCHSAVETGVRMCVGRPREWH